MLQTMLPEIRDKVNSVYGYSAISRVRITQTDSLENLDVRDYRKEEENTIKEQKNDIEIEEFEEDVEVPFAVIENVPVFPGCERGNNEKKRKCMSDKIAKFVQRKFNTDLAGDLGLTGRQRISVIFKIDKSGNVTGVRARAPHPRLEKEAQRVINLLQKMQPGKQRGKAVIDARGASSATSAAKAAIDTIIACENPTESGECFSAAVASDGSYDVIVPASGGKDSVYVSHILKHKYGMTPPVSYTHLTLPTKA